jgi:hypothetical protein
MTAMTTIAMAGITIIIDTTTLVGIKPLSDRA